MKKKVLYGFAMALIASASMGTLQSCKDDLSDFKHQYNYDQDGLLKRVTALETAVANCKTDCKNRMDALEADIRTNATNIENLDAELRRLGGMFQDYVTLTDLETRLGNLKSEVLSEANTNLTNTLANYATKQDLADEVAAITAEVSGNLKNDIAAEVAKQLADLNLGDVDLSEINSKVDALNTLVDGLNTKVNDLLSEMSGVKDDINNLNGLKGDVDQNKAEIAALKATLNNYDQALRNFDGLLKILEAQVLGHTEEIEGLRLEIATLDAKIDEASRLAEENLNNAVSTLIAQIDQLFNKLTNRLDNLVTGILIQGVKSPVFGDFRLPIGIQSNVLFNWYGLNSQDLEIVFPTNDKAVSATGDINLNRAVKPKTTVTIPAGDYYGDVTLGKVYVTLNPVGAKFNNLELSIEPSAGEALPFKVALEPSDEVLYHGYSRSVENGFYEGVVKMEANDENIKATRIEIEESLKSSMKDALKDPSKRTAVALLKGLYDQMSGMLPAYALRYDWTSSEVPSLAESMDPGFSVKSQAVLSKYDLAVATARPLSFNFLSDTSIKHKLPIISPMENLIQKLIDEGDFSLDLDSIKIGKANISFGNITISTTVDMQRDAIKIILPDITVTDPEGHPMTVDYNKNITLSPDVELKGIYDSIQEGLENALKQVQNDVNEWTGTQGESIDEQLNAILSDVQDQVNKMIGSINGSISDMLGNVADKFDPYFDKINKVFDIYNKIANKVNRILDDPNAYLQVTALYNMNGSYGFVSGDSKYPTTFKQAGGNAFNLYLTSYTGELIVPAYKKYVAITGVTKKGQPVSVDLNALNNNSADLNKVLDGSRVGVQVSAKGLEVGNVYEFTYQAIDYRGFTSTRKFYIEVK